VSQKNRQKSNDSNADFFLNLFTPVAIAALEAIPVDLIAFLVQGRLAPAIKAPLAMQWADLRQKNGLVAFCRFLALLTHPP
jgi:hypothetical protein